MLVRYWCRLSDQHGMGDSVASGSVYDMRYCGTGWPDISYGLVMSEDSMVLCLSPMMVILLAYLSFASLIMVEGLGNPFPPRGRDIHSRASG